MFFSAKADANACKAKVECQIFIVLDQVCKSKEESVQGIRDNLLAEGAGGCYRDRIAIYSPETFLIYRVLTLRGQNLFLTLVVD